MNMDNFLLSLIRHPHIKDAKYHALTDDGYMGVIELELTFWANIRLLIFKKFENKFKSYIFTESEKVDDLYGFSINLKL